jgi:hypothetical protein
MHTKASNRTRSRVRAPPAQEPVALDSHAPLARHVTLALPPKSHVALQDCPISLPAQFAGQEPLTREAVGTAEQLVGGAAIQGSTAQQHTGYVGVTSPMLFSWTHLSLCAPTSRPVENCCSLGQGHRLHFQSQQTNCKSTAN